MARSDQKFTGVLKDKELYLIEDALIAFKEAGFKTGVNINKLVLKLYQEFSEA